MSTPKQYFQNAKHLFHSVRRLGRAVIKGLVNWLLRVLMRLWGNPSRLTQQGFVLPTVVMVMLVVTLLTTAIVFRSFDRAKNASNFRVNQTVLNAATPGIDRAKAKIEALFADPTLPQGTPSDLSIENVLNRSKYTLGDEDRIQIKSGKETLTTAWRFPVDTDNNGLYDTISLYGIYFGSPQTAAGNEEERSALDARTPPMADEAANNPACAQAVGTSASLVGANGWYKVKGHLKKAFFVYVATVPITDKDEGDFTLPSIGQDSDYENYTGGNRGFSALEYQQDFERIPLSNNAIVYDDDLESASGPDFQVNGRIFTNSNLLVREAGSGDTILRQVSSPASCFYEAENGKIVVGGNYVSGNTHNPKTSEIETHLFKEGEKPTEAKLDPKNASVKEDSTKVAYNNKAYNQRINYLVNEAFDKGSGNDPTEVQDKSQALQNDPTNPLPEDKARRQALEIYFRNRTRRVPYAEVASGANALTGAALVGSKDDLRPPDAWIFPFDTDVSTGVSTKASKTGLNLNGTSTLNPPATEFETQQEQGNESLIGDRALIGNNLPALWYIDPDGDGNDVEFVGEDALQDIEKTEWDAPKGEEPRQRKTRVRQLDDLDTIARDGFWEIKAAEQPKNRLDGVGGLRIVTGAGVYLPFDDDIGATDVSNVVWPDTMPVIDYLATTPPSWIPDSLMHDPDGSGPLPPQFPVDALNYSRPFLKMRASAVYYYTHEEGKKPIACVNNYYDPTDSTTADPDRDDNGDGVADNGQVYGPAAEATKALLRYQANLVYPNGRPVNQLLRDALAADYEGQELTIAQQAAIDSTSCALSIYNELSGGSLTGAGALGAVPGGYNLPDGTIRETAFLDARQVKYIDNDYDPADDDPSDPKDQKQNTGSNNTVLPIDEPDPEPVPAPGYNSLTGNYDLPIEQRYPLEVRATVIDLDSLRQEEAAGGFTKEYMLPNSGIIYATRDDALPDMSNSDGSSLSATDFRLDPTRRPNGIMVTRGQKLWREEKYREEEKGLILASNLPVYVKGTFNEHTEEEFIDNNQGFYDRSNLNKNFACRPKDPRLPDCTIGDEWRIATILSDAVTVLSADFREGYRVEGDYDLRNNQIDNVANPDTSNPISDDPDIKAAAAIRTARRNQGFWDNNFVTNGLSSGYQIPANYVRSGFPSSAVTPTDAFYSNTSNNNVINSSYFNNFVTPVQRRTVSNNAGLNAPEYVMEICRKLPVSECQAGDWVTGYDINNTGALNNNTFGDPNNDLITWFDVDGDGSWYDNTGTVDLGDIEANIKASDLAAVLAGAPTPINAFNSPPPAGFGSGRLGAGTTTQPALIQNDRRFARRVAFLRYTNDTQILPAGSPLNNSSSSPNDLVLHRQVAASTPTCSTNGDFINPQDCWTPVVIGIDNNPNGALEYYAYAPYSPNGTNIIQVNSFAKPGFVGGNPHPVQRYDNSNKPRQIATSNTLWYEIRTRPGGPLGALKYGFANPPNYRNLLAGNNQPLLVPVLQLQYPNVPAPDNQGNLPAPKFANEETNWLPRAKEGTTITNMIVATGDSPSRPPVDNHEGDFSGGVPNIVRFIENWKWGSGNSTPTSQISGSFIQIKRSEYATAPYFQLPNVNNTGISSLFNYDQEYTNENAGGKVPYFEPPGRNWGFDVGILSQLPDLFSQQFTTPPTDDPNEFFREVSRDDQWVQTLLCGEVLNNNGDTTGNAINADQRSCT